VQPASARPASSSDRRKSASEALTGLVHTIEQVTTLEATLWNILEGLKSSATYVSFFCREYWGASGSKAQLSIDRLEWSEKLKRQVQQASVMESLSLAVASFHCSGNMQEISVAVRSRLSNLLYYVHENCLVLLDLLRQRMQYRLDSFEATLGEAAGTVFISRGQLLNFEILVRAGRYRALRKGEHVLVLKQQSEMVTNILRQLCRGASVKQAVPARNRGDQSPGHPSRGGARTPAARSATGNMASVGGVLRVVNDILGSATPLDKLRVRSVYNNMLQFTRFQPLLNLDGLDPDCPWPAEDPYPRFGADRLAADGPIIWFEPLPPMMTDLEKTPCLPPARSPGGYTLVLDLDETLVHYYEFEGVGNYGIRPGMHEFLERMRSVGYELVIFTAATQDYADWVIGQIDPNGLVEHRLYRQNTLPWGPLFVKDLSRLNRDLERTLIIDNVQENFMLHPNNGIFISTWYDHPNDTALFELVPLLEELITTRARVPEILDRYREQIPMWAGLGRAPEYCDAGLEGSFDDTLPVDGVGVELEHTSELQAAAWPRSYAPVELPAAVPVGHQGAPLDLQHQQHEVTQQQGPLPIPRAQACVPQAHGPPLPQRTRFGQVSGISGPCQAPPPQDQRPPCSGPSGPFQALPPAPQPSALHHRGQQQQVHNFIPYARTQ
jgi:Dullard-like phosphatase family protein